MLLDMDGPARSARMTQDAGSKLPDTSHEEQGVRTRPPSGVTESRWSDSPCRKMLRTIELRSVGVIVAVLEFLGVISASKNDLA